MAIALGRKGSLWQALLERQDQPFVAAAAFLGPLVMSAPAARPFEFFSGVLSVSRLRFASRLGSEANDAIDALLDLALDYEEQNGTSLAAFVNWFASGSTEIRRDMEAGGGEVRIMTVHGAKGLEAPIVILPDTTGKAVAGGRGELLMLETGNGNARVPFWPVPHNFNSPAVDAMKQALSDAQIHESRRLLYVAMTRARDELYICGANGERALPADSWYAIAAEVIKSLPGTVTLSDGKGWRYGAAPVHAAEQAPQRQTETEALPGWLTAPPAPEPVTVAEPRAAQRSSARVARGLLIHRILQQVPGLDPQEREPYVAAAVRRAGHDAALAADIMRLIADPVMAELLSEDGLSEVPLIVAAPDGRPRRSRIDRLVVTDRGLLVADYKTDRQVPDTIEACNPDYLWQLAAYREALRRIHPGADLRFELVWTHGPRLMPVPDDVLDRHADQLSVTRP